MKRWSDCWYGVGHWAVSTPPMDKRVKSPGYKIKSPRADRSQYEGCGDSNDLATINNEMPGPAMGVATRQNFVTSNLQCCTQNILQNLRRTSRSG